MNKQTYLTFIALPLCAVLFSACGGGSSTPNDSVKPVLTLKGSAPLSIPLNSTFTDPGATAIDETDGDISSKIIQTNNINTGIAACYSQRYQVADEASNQAIKKRTVFVGNDTERHSPNHPPVALEDSQSTIYTNSLTFNVLKNDSDSDCDSLSVTAITQPTPGIATLNADKTITFNSHNTIGSFYLTYTISDGHGGTDTKGISIASHDPKDGNENWPEALDDVATTHQGTKVFIDVLANDSDSDGDNLILETADTPKHGTLKIESNGLLYTPAAGFTGTESFYYGIHDAHGHIDSAIVNVTVTP